MQIWKYYDNSLKNETILKVEVREVGAMTEVRAHIPEQEHYDHHYDWMTREKMCVLAIIYETGLDIDPTKWVGLTLEEAWLKTKGHA